MTIQTTRRRALRAHIIVVLLAVAILSMAFRPAVAAAESPQAAGASSQADDVTFPSLEDSSADDAGDDGPGSEETTSRSARVPDAPAPEMRFQPVSDLAASIETLQSAVASNRLDAALLAAVENGGAQTALVLFAELVRGAEFAEKIFLFLFAERAKRNKPQALRAGFRRNNQIC